MKKLMTALATAATALFAIGAANGDEAPLNATSFEQLTLNTQLNTLADDTGDTEGTTKYWYMASSDADNGTLVTNGVAASGVSRPDNFASATNEKALSLDTSSPLFRHMGSGDGTIPSTGEQIGDGIYLDTLVKFTAADDVFGADALGQGDKIAISYVEREEETADGVVTVSALTNFVIRAGYIGGEGITATNYIATLPAGVEFKKDAWHRLTVRTLPGIDTVGNLGFVVYVDQVALVYADTNQTIGDNVNLAGAALSLDKSVFPSAVAFNNGTDGLTITAASFSGTGAIDDVVFTKVMPQFIAASSAVPVSITLGTGVTDIEVSIDGTTVAAVDATANPRVFNLPAGSTTFDISETLDTGYANFSAIFGEGSTATFANGTVTFSEMSLEFTVKASRNNFNLFDAQNQAISGTFETLSDALDASGVAKIQLAYDYNVADYEGIPEEGSVLTISKSCVLDLNGNTLSAANTAEEAFINVPSGVTLTIIDSSVANTGTIRYNAEYGIIYAVGTCFIGAVTGDNGPNIVGAAVAEDSGVYVIRGKFDAASNTVTDGETGESAFAWTTGDGDALECTAKRSGDYWVVAPSGDTPTTYALTLPDVKVADVTAATATVKADGAAVDDITAIAAGTVVTVEWTAVEGYKITDGATQTITMDADKTATAPIVEVITYATLTITPVNNCTIVVSNTTAEVASGAKFDVDDNVQLTVYRTPAEGFKLAANCLAEETITMDQDRAVTASVVQDGEKTYPAYIDETEKTKYDSWADYAEISATDFPDAQGTNEEAYLLNCKLNEITAAKAAFKFTGISYDATKEEWVTTTTTGYNGREYNGTVTVKQYSDVGCTTESETGTFFKAVLQ